MIYVLIAMWISAAVGSHFTKSTEPFGAALLATVFIVFISGGNIS